MRPATDIGRPALATAGDMSTATTKGLLYWRVNEGSGHVLDFDDVARGNDSGPHAQASKIWLVGTYACRTCVGLYVQISLTRCLMLHINAVPAQPSRDGAPYNRLVDEVLGHATQQKVARALEDLAASIDWEPTGQERVVVCCPLQEAEDFLKADEPQLYTSHYIMRAIRQFLKKETLDAQNWEGFIADQRKGKCVKLGLTKRKGSSQTLKPGGRCQCRLRLPLMGTSARRRLMTGNGCSSSRYSQRSSRRLLKLALVRPACIGTACGEVRIVQSRSLLRPSSTFEQMLILLRISDCIVKLLVIRQEYAGC